MHTLHKVQCFIAQVPYRVRLNMRVTTSVAVPGPGSGIRCLFEPWIQDPGWVKKSRSRYGIRDELPGSYFRDLKKQFLGLKYLNFSDAHPDPGSEIFLTLDPGGTKFGSRIRDKHPGSATLVTTVP